MNNKEQRLIEKCKNIQLTEGRILISPHRLRTYKVIQTVMDDEANKGRDPLKDEMKTKEVEEKVNRRFQKATVIKVPDDETRVKEGDVIIYSVGRPFEFDLIKGASILQKYDITGVIKPKENGYTKKRSVPKSGLADIKSRGEILFENN